MCIPTHFCACVWIKCEHCICELTRILKLYFTVRREDGSGLNCSAAVIWFTLGLARTAALPNNLWCSAKMLLVFGPDERGNDVDEIDLVASEVSPLLGPCSMCTTLHKLSLTYFKFSITSPSVLSTMPFFKFSRISPSVFSAMFVYEEQITWFVLAGSKSAVHAFLMSRRTSMSRPPSF